MAEILIRADVSWMEDVPQEDKDKWTIAMWAKYNRRRRKGNPICVKPDGTTWGKKECPPRYIILKMPGMKVEDARKYTEQTYYPPVGLEPPETKRIRRWNFEHTEIDDCITNIGTTEGIITTDKTTFEANLTDEALAP